MSDTPHDNSDWLKAVYYDIIQEYIVKSIPTENGFADYSSNVKIKDIQTDIPLSIVNEDYQWFKWDGDNVAKLLSSAKEKLRISTLDIYSLIIYANVNKLNYWISSIDDATYESFLDEINETPHNLRNPRFLQKIRSARLFRFTDGKYRSYDDIIKEINGKPNFACRRIGIQDRIIFTTTKTEDISDELIALGFVLSKINILNSATASLNIFLNT